VSRTELAEMFLRPPPQDLLKKALQEGWITQEQAQLSQRVPVADDISVESDSGGHTDNRAVHVVLPMIIRLRNRIQEQYNYAARPRVGAGGGMGCPQALAAAFAMGAAFITTGTVNQLCKQSGSSDRVRKALAKASYSDVTMAPAADMFDEGVQLQVLKKGTMFPSRAKKLYELFCRFDSIEDIPKEEIARLEQKVFRVPLSEVWDGTKDYYINFLHDEAKILKAESDGKLKMSLIFRWYLGRSSGWANFGDADREADYQVWCGPAIGPFNDFIKGTYMDPTVANAYPCVCQANLQLLRGAAFLQRVASIRYHPALDIDVDALGAYSPQNPL